MMRLLTIYVWQSNPDTKDYKEIQDKIEQYIHWKYVSVTLYQISHRKPLSYYSLRNYNSY